MLKELWKPSPLSRRSPLSFLEGMSLSRDRSTSTRFRKKQVIYGFRQLNNHVFHAIVGEGHHRNWRRRKLDGQGIATFRHLRPGFPRT